ncbi:NYN domain-containing protein [Hydrogenibacillus sp. N12]|uniref:NYN domain-containing protein n=1 Tax=Hydrogenibacillus sp. N12 TaxID=2866627 RepID=UPI001C7D7F1A|nr:NYN domain-containing protein [Hydrogenibacillus sp. N12]QZA33109.1 NYN domain-containing protein [Hydrogenibacillus sp. N12]
MATVIVDGYNLIGRRPDLGPFRTADLDAARASLIAALDDYAGATGHTIVVVFDADRSPAGEIRERAGRIDVVYTAYGRTADAWIEAEVRRLRGRVRGELVVATDDRLIAVAARAVGASVVGARELWADVERVRREVGRFIRRRQLEAERPGLGARLPKEVRLFFEKYRRKKDP